VSTRACLVLVFLLSASAPAAEPAPGDVAKRLDELRHSWQDEELPVPALALDPDQGPAGSISRAQAVEDVERLFYLLSHGYSGYAFFDGDGNFERARAGILGDLEERAEWEVEDLADLFRHHLSFIHDCHTRVGGRAYGGHRDFWFDTTLDIHKTDDGFHLDRKGVSLILTSISGDPPETWLKPSLSESGEALHRIGTLSSARPDPVVVEATGNQGTRRFEIELRRSDFFSYSRDIFREDRIGGIPVLRIRSFSEHHEEHIERFLETADRYREASCVIVDLRGNGGGSEAYVIEWIRRLTDRRAGSAFFTCELKSRTTMMGRANYMTYLLDLYPKADFYRREAARFLDSARSITEPLWAGPFTPQTARIPNDTTVVIITNGRVASAGEGFVMRARHAENVVVVGENTHGALTFGNVSAHQLPHSKMNVRLPINFGLFPDLVFREEEGLAPDYWVPAPDAVNCAVAALRKGTIRTTRPFPREWLEQEFTPEDTNYRETLRTRRRLIILGIAILAAALWSYVMRKRPRLLTGLGAMYAVIGTVWTRLAITKGPFAADAGAGILTFGVVGLLCGVVMWVSRSRKAAQS